MTAPNPEEVAMHTMSVDHDQPADLQAGLAARRERVWGVVGGLVGAAFGVGSALIAVFVEGSPWWSRGGAYPEFFATRRLLAFDVFLIAGMVVGLGFMVAALVSTRLGRYPRTDGYGAGLIGTILCALGGTLLFTRLVAVIAGR